MGTIVPLLPQESRHPSAVALGPSLATMAGGHRGKEKAVQVTLFFVQVRSIIVHRLSKSYGSDYFLYIAYSNRTGQTNFCTSHIQIVQVKTIFVRLGTDAQI